MSGVSTYIVIPNLSLSVDLSQIGLGIMGKDESTYYALGLFILYPHSFLGGALVS